MALTRAVNAWFLGLVGLPSEDGCCGATVWSDTVRRGRFPGITGYVQEGPAMAQAKAKTMLLAAAALLLFAGACSSSPSSTSSGQGGTTYTIGILTDATGLAASADRTTVQGVEAGIAAARQQGYNFKYVVGDTQTSPAGTLAAAQKLVDENHVDAVVAVSGLTFAAAPFLTAQGVPVVGSPQDGPEWPGSKNMFSVFGFVDTTKVATTIGKYLKMEGATTVGTLGYGIVPSASEAAKSYAASAQVAGLKAGYVNGQFPFGSTNVDPVALAMKSAGVDGIATGLEPNTAFALLTALNHTGVTLRASLLATGYGGDLTQGGPGALQTAQGASFYLIYQPVELRTPATTKFQNALRTASIKTDPTFAEYLGYASIDALVRGLQVTGPNPTHASLIRGLASVHNFDAAGLLDGHTVDFGSRAANSLGPDNCLYMTKLVGSTFQLVPGADPICGTIVPGLNVSPSS
jgi:ABC-type branched-subunit amino acid transport system substrate-binding protein